MSEANQDDALLKVKPSDVLLFVLVLIAVFYAIPTRVMHYRRRLLAARTANEIGAVKTDWYDADTPSSPAGHCCIAQKQNPQ